MPSVYPVGSLANHSCTPNCVQVFDGSKLFYRCIRDIAPGEEVLISYVDACSLESERRDFLAKEYFFDISGRAAAEAAESRGEEVAPGVRLFQGEGAGKGKAKEMGGPEEATEEMLLPKSLVNARERPLVTIEAQRGAGGPWEEAGRAFVLARKEGEGSSAEAESETAHERRGDGPASRQLVSFASSFSAGVGDILGDDVVAVCRFDQGAWATMAADAAAAGALLQNVHKYLGSAEALSKAGRFAEAVETLRATLDLCTNGAAGAAPGTTFRLGESHISRIRAQALLLHLSLQLGKFDLALRVAQALVQPYR